MIYNGNANIELGVALKQARNVKFNVTKWQKDELIVGALTDALNDLNNPAKTAYKNDLLKSGNVVMNRVIRIKGFTADIELNSTISPELKANLTPGVIAKVGEANEKVTITVVNNRSIKLKSDDDFFVFGKFSKISK